MEDMETVCLGRSGNSYQESIKLLRALPMTLVTSFVPLSVMSSPMSGANHAVLVQTN